MVDKNLSRNGFFALWLLLAGITPCTAEAPGQTPDLKGTGSTAARSYNPLPESRLSSIFSFRNSTPIKYSKPLSGIKKKQLEQKLKDYLQTHQISDVYAAVEFSLDFVADNLSFRLNYLAGKRGSRYFIFPEGEKSTDCIDYAYLFRETLSTVAKKTGLKGVEARVMRSKDAYLFGVRMDSHDWVEVKDKKQKITLKVDPTFYDYGLGYNLETLVK